MKVGDIVRHNDYPGRLEILKIDSPVVTLMEIEKPKMVSRFCGMDFQLVVCFVEKLNTSVRSGRTVKDILNENQESVELLNIDCMEYLKNRAR